MAHGDTKGQGDRYATADERVAACSIACIGYSDDSTLPVAGRTHAEATLYDLLTHALADVAAQTRIVLEGDEGIVVVFLTDPAHCLAFGLALREAARAHSEPSLRWRMGLHYGPLRLVPTHHGEPQFDGEGLEAGWRIASHAQGGEIAASASFVAVLGKQSSRYQQCFTPMTGADGVLPAGEALYACSAVVPLSAQSEASVQTADDSLGAMPDKTRFGAKSIIVQRLNRPAIATALAVVFVLVLAVLLRQSLLSEGEQVETPLQASSSAAAQSTPRTRQQDLSGGLAPPLASGLPDAAAKQGPTANSASLPRAPRTRDVPGSPATDDSLPEPLPTSKDKSSDAAKPPSGVPAPQEPGPGANVARAVPVPAQTRRQPAATGAVRFSVVPWGEIYIDGKRLGAAPPLRDIALQPGTHRIEVRNPGFAAYSQVIEVRAGDEIRIRHRFE